MIGFRSLAKKTCFDVELYREEGRVYEEAVVTRTAVEDLDVSFRLGIRL